MDNQIRGKYKTVADNTSIFCWDTDAICCTNPDPLEKFKQFFCGNKKPYRLQRGSTQLDDFSTSSVVFTKTPLRN